LFELLHRRFIATSNCAAFLIMLAFSASLSKVKMSPPQMSCGIVECTVLLPVAAVLAIGEELFIG
jgi:hypothetical protein